MTEAELSELVIHTDKILIHKDVVLGRGGYGYVCLGVLDYDDGSFEKVAVKMMITEGNLPDNVKKLLVKEACKLREVSQNGNIVKLLGVIMECNNYGLVLEFMVFENCVNFINDYEVIWPQNKLLIQFCHQVSSAMAYLHSFTPPMLHLDLKGDNILINRDFDAKICDFGIAEWKTRTTRLDRQGTISHVAPEIFVNMNIPSNPIQDVYSFGICIWEIFTGKRPYLGKATDLIKTCVKDGQRPDMTGIGERSPDFIVTRMKQCWHQDPEARPTFEALAQDFGNKHRSLRWQIFQGKKAVRRKICEKHVLNDIKHQQTVHWDNIEQPLDDNDISIDASPVSPQGTGEISADDISDANIPPLPGKSYKFSLMKKELTDFDKKVRDILRDPLLMEMVINGHADRLDLPQDITDLFSDPKLLQKYIDEDSEFKAELKTSSHSVFDNVHSPNIKAAQQKGIASQQEAKENDVFRYMKYHPTKSESEKTDRQKRQDARNRSMENCSYIGKLHKNGLYEKVMKALKEPHKIQEALNDLETGPGEAEKFNIISPDVLEALQDPFMLQILFSQNPQVLDQFMRFFPELTMRLLASNKTQYKPGKPERERRRPREDLRRSRPYDSDSDEEIKAMLEAGYFGGGEDYLPFLPDLMSSRHMDRRMREMFYAGAMRRRQEEEAKRRHVEVKKEKKMEPTNKKAPSPPSPTPNGRNNENSAQVEVTHPNADASVEKSKEPQVEVTPMEVSEPKPAGETKSPNRPHLSLEASMDEMSVEDTADGVILYSEMDRDTVEDKMGVTEAITTLKNLSRAKIPNLQLRLLEELPIGGLSEFDFIKYILNHFNYIFIYLTQNFNGDTLKRFQSQMCLQDTIVNKSWRVIPLMTEKNVPSAPLELQLLRPLQMWHLKNPDARVQEMFLDSFAKTIMSGREKGLATKSPGLKEDENNKGNNSPNAKGGQSDDQTGTGDQQKTTRSSQGENKREVSPGPTSHVEKEKDKMPSPHSEEPDPKKGPEKQDPDRSEPGIQTITYRHAGGGTTEIKVTPGKTFPNLQVGNKNIMIIGAERDVQKTSKLKTKKSKENVNLTESEEPPNDDDTDMVCSEIGKDWRRLCRQFGFSDGETGQFYQDFHLNGTYEVMYQAMRRWGQKSPKTATKKALAEILHRIDRDDLATQLK